jgi:hypothetical protein
MKHSIQATENRFLTTQLVKFKHIELAARAQSRLFRGELAELSDKGDVKQSHFTRGEPPPFEGGGLQT